MTGMFIPLSVEFADLTRGPAALVRMGPVPPHGRHSMRFLESIDYPTEGEFRARIADAVAQMLDELL